MNNMKKARKILTALFLIAVSVLIYLTTTIRIYTEPFVELVTAEPHSYQPYNKFCYITPSFVAPLRDNTLNLLVWNIHKGSDLGWQQDLTRFANTTDLMLLQEATSKQALSSVFKATFPTSFFTAGFSYKNITSGVEILAKTTPDMYCAGTGEEPWLRIPKVAQALRFPLENGQSLLIVNLHLVNFEWTPTQYRQQLEIMMDRIAEHKSAVILAGDFNSWNKDRLTLIRRLAAEQGLTEVLFENDQRLRFFGQPLDHIFVRGLAIKRAYSESVESSDHNPLRVELELITAQP